MASELKEMKRNEPKGSSTCETGLSAGQHTKLDQDPVESARPEPTPSCTSSRSIQEVGVVQVKCEPSSDDSPGSVSLGRVELLHSQSVTSSSGSSCVPETKPRPGVKPDHFKWINLPSATSLEEQDNRDDLKLTAYDVIAGVISTPPIKPLEPEATDNSSAKAPSIAGQSSAPVLTPTSSQLPTAANGSIVPGSRKDQHNLVHELDEFSKIMDEVTQEQTAIELAAATNKELDNFRQLYPSALSGDNLGSFHRHKLSHLASQTQEPLQQRSLFSKEKTPVEHGRPNVPRPLSLFNEIPASPSRKQHQVPHTPTTPLEHFSLPSLSPSRTLGAIGQHSQPHPLTPHKTPGTPNLHTTHHHTPHPNAPHQHTPHPNTPHQRTPHPSTPHQHTPHPNTPHQHTPHPNTPHQHTPHPNTPHQHTPHPNTPHQHTPHLNTPHPNTPHQHTPHPSAPHQHTPHPNAPHQHTPRPNAPHQHTPHPNTLHFPQHHLVNSAPFPNPTTSYSLHRACPQYPPTSFSVGHTPFGFDAMEQNNFSSLPGEVWSSHVDPFPPSRPLAHDQGSPSVASQGTLRDSIMARVSSRVVALAGQKRPPHLDLSAAPPPSKMKGVLNHGPVETTHISPLTQYPAPPGHAPSLPNHQSL